MHSRIDYALRTLRLLALLEHAPKYGRQIAKVAPDVFFSDGRVALKKQGGVPTQHIYMTLIRLQAAGLIQRVDDYKPPASLEIPARSRRMIVWYGLTTLGRRTLREAREALKVYIGEPLPCSTPSK
jgi:DNA-binding PadR family transcriptional regulator